MLPRSCLSRILRSLLSTRSARRLEATFRPGLELLEGRALPSATPLHLYELNGSLADDMGGPALASDGGVLTAGRYVFNANQGLVLSGGLTDTSNYSIVMLANLNTAANFFKKVIDFQSRSVDPGLYVVGSHLDLYPGGSGSGNVAPNQDFQVALTRNAATGETRIYLNGVLDVIYSGSISNVAIPQGNVLTFFEDDLISHSEAAPGSVDYIAIYNRPLTDAEVSELVNSPPAAPPSLTVNQASVTVNEGQTASNTGAWSNAASLTASIGAVTKNADGTWNWTFVSADGPNQTQTVTITAVGNTGLSTSTSFQLNVNNVAPTLALSGAALINEGATYTLNLSASDPGADSIQNWTINWGDGTIQNVPLNPNSATHVYADGPNSYTISATATDEDGTYSANSIGVTVNNVAPTANFASIGPVTFGQSATVSFSNQHDDSSADTTAGFHYAYSLTGDFTGITYADGSSTSASQSYPNFTAGDHTIYARIIDKDNGFSQYSTVGTVGKVHLTVTADAQSKTYDGAVFAPFTATLSGFVNGDDSSVVSGSAGFSGPATTAINAGVFTITPTLGTLSAANYDFATFNDGTLTINKASSTTTAAGDSFTYDGTTHTGGSGTVSGAGGLNVAATSLTYTGDQINAGTYLVTAHYAGDANHFGSDSAPAVITIAKANAVITIIPYSGTYDGAAHGLTGSAAGVEANPVNLTNLLHLGATFTDVPGGTATWTFDGNANYNAATGAAAVTILPASTTTTAVGGTFVYDGTPHAGSGSVNVSGGVVTIRYVGINGTNYDSTAAPVNAGSYSVIATYAGDNNHAGSTGSAPLTITAKLLSVSAWSQGTINIGSNGSIVLHLSIDGGQFYNSDTVLSLFNGATFTIKIQKADGSVTYGTLTSLATVQSDGSITISMQMCDSLRADLYDAYINGRAVNFNMTATSNGGNYSLDEDTMSRLLNNGALKYVVS